MILDVRDSESCDSPTDPTTVAQSVSSSVESRQLREFLQLAHEPRSKMPAIDFCLRWNLFFKKLNGVTRAQAFRKLRASSCTRKLRASPKSSRYFKDKYMNIQQEGLHNMMGSGFQRCSGNFAQGSRKVRASFAQAKGFLPIICPTETRSNMIVDSPYLLLYAGQ